MSGSTTADTGLYSCTATVGSGSESPKSDGVQLDVVGKAFFLITEGLWSSYYKMKNSKYLLSALNVLF